MADYTSYAPSLWRSHTQDPAYTSAFSLGDPDLGRDAFCQGFHMGDDAHDAGAAADALEDLQGVLNGLPVQGAEALVDEHGLQAVLVLPCQKFLQGKGLHLVGQRT